MNTLDAKSEVQNGNTVRVRRAVRNALRTQVVNAIRAGFSADCDFDNLLTLTFTEDAVLASAEGVLDCAPHIFSVAIPFCHIN